MDEQDRKERCCAFTGHRPEKLSMPENEVRQLLEGGIINAYNDGYRVFISGAAKGTDLWAADIVLQLREKHKEVKLICAIPFPSKETSSAKPEQDDFSRIVSNADEVVYVCDHYFKGCFQLRNKWMIDRASRLIAVWNGQDGGTKNAIDYARKTNIEIINLLDMTI